jgi:hypothetical protein
MTRLLKPCHLLHPGDLEAEPIWGFDVALESQPGSDETWVRPYRFDAVPRDSDVLFGAARLWPGTQRPRRGAITFRFVDGAFELDGCALLSPRYCAIMTAPGGRDRRYLESALGAIYATYFPLVYDAEIVIAGQRFAPHGTIEEP